MRWTFLKLLAAGIAPLLASCTALRSFDDICADDVTAKAAPYKVTQADFPVAVAAADGEVYYVNHGGGGDGTIRKIGACGGPAVELARGRRFPSGIALDSTYVYWADSGGGTVARVRRALAGEPPEELATGQIQPVAVAVDEGYVYFANQGTAPDYLDGSVSRLSLSGGDPEVLATDQHAPVAVAVNGSDLYWANQGSGSPGMEDGSIWKTNLASPEPKLVADGQYGPVALALSTTFAFWTNRGTPLAGSSDGSLMQASLQAPDAFPGSSVTVANLDKPAGIAIDGDEVYFLLRGGDDEEAEGQVFRADLPGNPIASDQVLPTAIAVLDAQVFWVNYGKDRNGGQVERAPR